MLTYAAALDALKAAERFGIHPSLDGIRALTEALERPQDAFATVQVTGTNGKSSTTRMIASLLEAHGVRAGVYTSPELESMTERIEIAGEAIGEGDFARAITAACFADAGVRESGLRGADATSTQFELLTAAALWIFRARHVEVASLEVGMGGRWDATSVVDPRVAVVTGVGVDHAQHLGTTREAIAREKSHIIKQGAVAILGPGTAGVDAALIERAKAVGAEVIAVREVGATTPVAEARTVRFETVERPSTPGGRTTLRVKGLHGQHGAVSLSAPAYQAANVAAAVAATEAYLDRALDDAAMREALENMIFPGRFELVMSEPPVVIDGAHNPQAASVLADALRDAWPDPSCRPLLLLGVLDDKDARGIVAALAPAASGIAVTQSASPRALDRDSLASVVAEVTGVRPRTFATVRDALGAIAGESPWGLVVSGSITTAGEARAWARDAGKLA